MAWTRKSRPMQSSPPSEPTVLWSPPTSTCFAAPPRLAWQPPRKHKSHRPRTSGEVESRFRPPADGFETDLTPQLGGPHDLVARSDRQPGRPAERRAVDTWRE